MTFPAIGGGLGHKSPVVAPTLARDWGRADLEYSGQSRVPSGSVETAMVQALAR